MDSREGTVNECGPSFVSKQQVSELPEVPVYRHYKKKWQTQCLM